jgi:CubicO group peptidase (beta-lactamase class C family)
VGNDLRRRLRELISTELARFDVPGCAVTVVRDDHVVLCEGFGARDVDRGLPVTAQTVFPIGSSTKTFTAALVGLLVTRGLAEWDQPVRDLLPGFRMHDPVATEMLSLRDCLSHRSGLPRHDLLWYARDAELTRDDLVAALRHLQPTRPFRQSWQYNNLLYTLAGHLAGTLLGGGFEAALRREILQPLSMSRSTTDLEQVQALADHARPYVLKADGLRTVPHASLRLVGPAGNLNSCAEDVVPWLATLLGDRHQDVVPGSVLTELKAVTMPTPPATLPVPALKVGYGLGLTVEDFRGMRLWHHGGNIDGFSSQVLICPQTRTGIAVLANLDNTGIRDALPYLILDLLDGAVGEDHGAMFKACYDLLLSVAAAADAARTSTKLGLPPVRPLEDYVGTYEHLGYGRIKVTPDSTGLRMDYGSIGGPLEHRHLEVFTAHIDAQGTVSLVPVQFGHDVDGAVNHLMFSIEPTMAPLTFVRTDP